MGKVKEALLEDAFRERSELLRAQEQQPIGVAIDEVIEWLRVEIASGQHDPEFCYDMFNAQVALRRIRSGIS